MPRCAAAKRRPNLFAEGSRARRETSAGRAPGACANAVARIDNGPPLSQRRSRRGGCGARFSARPAWGKERKRRAADEPAKGFGSGEARRRRPCFANAKYYGTNTFHKKALDTPSKWEGRVS